MRRASARKHSTALCTEASELSTASASLAPPRRHSRAKKQTGPVPAQLGGSDWLWHDMIHNSLAWHRAHRHTCTHWLYINFMSLRTSLQHTTWQSATPMLFFTMPRLCPRLSDQRQRDGWPQHMVPHEFHHSPKLHGQNTPWGHNHDGDPDVWIKILSVKWRSIWIPSTYKSYKSQLCKFWDVLFSSFKFCFNSNESFSMNPMGAEWEPNEFSAMQGTVLSPPKVPSKPSHEAGFSVMHLLSADRLPRRGHLDLIVKALEHFEDPTLKYAKQTNKQTNHRTAAKVLVSQEGDV